MGRGNKHNTQIIIGGILLLLIIVYLNVGGKTLTVYPSSPNAFLVLSSGQSQYYSTDPVIGGKTWLVTVSLSGGGQSIIYGQYSTNGGVMNPSDFQSFAGQNVPLSPVKIEAYVDNANNSQCAYPLILSGSFKSLTYTSQQPCQFLQGGMDVMQNMGNYKSDIDNHLGCYYSSDAIYYDATGARVRYFVCARGTHTLNSWSLQCNSDWCWYEAWDPILNHGAMPDNAPLGQLTCKYYSFSPYTGGSTSFYQPTWTQTPARGKFVFTKMSTGATEEVPFSVPNIQTYNSSLQGDVYINYAGSLSLGTNCPDASASVMVLQTSTIVDKSWLVGPSSVTALNLTFANDIRSLTPDVAANNYQTAYAHATTAATDFPSATVATNAGIPQTLTQTIPAPVQTPVFAIRLKADWLGIYVPSGMPSLSSCTYSPQPIISGQTGTISGTLKNVGDTGSTFSVGITCNNGLTPTTTFISPPPTLPANQVATVNFIVQGAGGLQDISSTCTITATDTGKTSNTASCQVTATIHSQSCSDGTPYSTCSTNKPLYCSAGSLISRASICGCPTGQTPNGDVCVLPPSTCSDGTHYSSCSTTQPKYCSAGSLIDKASVCGCPSGLVVSGDTCVNPQPTTCSDGTAYAACSATKPKYCNAGTLVDKASVCGCPTGMIATGDICVPPSSTCSDGTTYTTCSVTKPKYCDAGSLVDKASVCGCPTGQVASGDACTTPQQGCAYSNPDCTSPLVCQNNLCVNPTPNSGCLYHNPDCTSPQICRYDNSCVMPSGCKYNNPACGSGYTCNSATNTCDAGTDWMTIIEGIVVVAIIIVGIGVVVMLLKKKR